MQQTILKAAKKAVQPVSEKNPSGFDFAKYERLQKEEADLL